MSLVLLSTQTKDAKIMYLTDNSIWDDGDLPTWGSITSASLEISYKTPDIPDGTQVYTKDITSIFTGASSQSNLVFPVTSSDIGLGGNAQLPDGIYSINYIVSNGTGTGGDPWSFDSNLEILNSNIIKAEVYKRVGTIAYQYYCNNNYYTKPIDDDLLLQSLYDSMVANAYVAKQAGILNILEVLQRQTQ